MINNIQYKFTHVYNDCMIMINQWQPSCADTSKFSSIYIYNPCFPGDDGGVNVGIS